MPGYDGTGPSGKGPMTGQGLGYCVLKDSPRNNGFGIRGYAGLAGRPVPAGSPVVYGYRRPYFFGRGFPARRFGPGIGRGRGRGRGRRFFMGGW